MGLGLILILAVLILTVPVAVYVARAGGFAAFQQAHPAATLLGLTVVTALGIAALPGALFWGVIDANMLTLCLWAATAAVSVLSARFLVQALVGRLGAFRAALIGHLTVLAILAILFAVLLWWNSVEVATSTKDSWSFATLALSLPYGVGYAVVVLFDAFLLARKHIHPSQRVALT